MVALPVRFEKHSHGPLQVWEAPQRGRQYIVSADAAGGGEFGDYPANVVLDGETCAVVAIYRNKIDPHQFGPVCARLASYYNTAILVFETAPSAHGYAAATEAKNAGYSRLYWRHAADTFVRTQSGTLGWHTNSVTKPQMISRVKRALADGCPIPSADLLQEIKGRSWDEHGQLADSTDDNHDDLFICYAMGLMVRDQMWVRGQLKTKPEELVTWEDRYFARKRKRLMSMTPTAAKVRIYDGA